MMIYIITFIFCFIISVIYSTKEKKLNYKIIFKLLVIFFILVVGLRSEKVGIDTSGYKKAYEAYSVYSFKDLTSYNIFEDEVGYYFINILFNKLGMPWEIFSLFMAALFIIPVMFLIYKENDNWFYTCTFFILLNWWTYPMSTMRQAAAIGLTIIAFLFEKKNKNIICIILILVAQTIHHSAIISLIYLVIRKIPLNKNNAIFWFTVGAFFIALGMSPFRNIMFSFLQYFERVYSVNNQTGGLLMELFYVLTLLIGWLYSSKETDKKYWQYYKAIFLSAILLPIVRINPALYRICQYFSIYLVVFIPMMMKSIPDKKIRLIGGLSYYSVFSYLFLTTILSSNMKLIPYKFFWN